MKPALKFEKNRHFRESNMTEEEIKVRK